MRILVISDTHGAVEASVACLKDEKDIDLLIHLGDYTQDAVEISNQLDIDLIHVRGNCDMNDMETPDEEVIALNDKKFLLTHGHHYGVKMGVDRLYYRAKELEVDGVLFGHSHIQTHVTYENMVFMNPGSPVMPRGGSPAGYGIIDLQEDLKTYLVEIDR